MSCILTRCTYMYVKNVEAIHSLICLYNDLKHDNLLLGSFDAYGFMGAILAQCALNSLAQYYSLYLLSMHIK
jgi:hypothetical protein